MQQPSLWGGPSRAIPFDVSRGRGAATAAAFIAIISLSAACSSGGSKGSTAAANQHAAAENRAAAAQHRRAATAERSAASKLLATKPAKKKVRRTTPTTGYHATAGLATTPRIRTAAATTPAGDLGRIERTVSALNTAFSARACRRASRIRRVRTTGSVRACTPRTSADAFETARGEGIVSEAIVVHPDTFTPAPGWVDPVIGRVPQGRIYRVVIDEIQTLVTTGARRERTFAIHVTVRPDGRGRLFLRCA